jgi:exosortase A-associated hydrolase 2
MLHVPAFAEEMNKSRRVVATTARALASSGWQVMTLDLLGTGDSSGDFGDTDWVGWVEDVRFAWRWLEQRSGAVPALWGLRVGCLLINEALSDLACERLLFWQPALNGDAALRQFLRLRTMASVAKPGVPSEKADSMLHALEAGGAIEVAGYRLATSVALPLRTARLGGPVYAGKKVLWIEIVAPNPSELPPASQARAQELRQAGARVEVHCVEGLGFWMTQEIDECPALVDATVAALSSESWIR